MVGELLVQDFLLLGKLPGPSVPGGFRILGVSCGSSAFLGASTAFPREFLVDEAMVDDYLFEGVRLFIVDIFSMQHC